MLVSVIGSLYYLLYQSCFIITCIILVYCLHRFLDCLKFWQFSVVRTYLLSDIYRFVCAVISTKTLSGKNSL